MTTCAGEELEDVEGNDENKIAHAEEEDAVAGEISREAGLTVAMPFLRLFPSFSSFLSFFFSFCFIFRA